MRGLLLLLILTQASCMAPGANPGSTAGGGPAGAYAGAGGSTVSAASGGDAVEGDTNLGGSQGDSAGFRDPTVYAAAPAGGMQSGNIAPLGGDPKGRTFKIAFGQQVTTCRLPTTDLKNVHVRGQTRAPADGTFGRVADNYDLSNTVIADMVGLKLRVIYPKGADDFYYRDFDFLAILPSADGGPVMTTQHPTVQYLPLAYFDFDVATSDPVQLRYVTFKGTPGTTEQPCQSRECTDGTMISIPPTVFSHLEISDPETLPPCLEPKMEIYNKS